MSKPSPPTQKPVNSSKISRSSTSLDQWREIERASSIVSLPIWWREWPSKHGCGHDLGLGVDAVFVVVGKRKGSILVRPSGGESGPGKEQAAWQVVGDNSMLPLSQVNPRNVSSEREPQNTYFRLLNRQLCCFFWKSRSLLDGHRLALQN